MTTTTIESSELHAKLPSVPTVFTPTLMHTISGLTTNASSEPPDTTVVVSEVSISEGDTLSVPAGTEVAIVTVNGTSTTPTIDVGIALSDVDVVVFQGTAGINITFSNVLQSDSALITSRAVVALTGNNDIKVDDAVPSVIVVNTGDNTVSGGEGADKIVTGSGNTTVHGGDGADIIFTGSGTATLDAGDGDDTIITGSGDVTVDAGAGADTIVTSTGNTTIAGGDGGDTIILAGSGTGTTMADGGSGFDSLNIARSADQLSSEVISGALVITDLITGAITQSSNVEYVSLLNGDAIVVCANSNQAAIAQMYESFLARAADAGGLHYWFDDFDANQNLDSIATALAAAGGFESPDTNVGDFVEQMYLNTFGHGSDTDGKAYWVDVLNNQGATFSEVGLSFAMIAVASYGDTAVTTVGNINIIEVVVA